ncbi:MAG: N-acetylmuramoyl-L-alanine amidase, partial [Acutalibacteraceae bacterium]|nr:N-acetylmuramoyl-L-alanine amidase [Acutalibacteraceae bacterium]
NSDTISVEVCHPDDTGKFNDNTYDAVMKLTSWLLKELGLDESAVIRHYDITEKLCPLYYVEHEDAWNQMKKDIGTKLNEYSK